MSHKENILDSITIGLMCYNEVGSLENTLRKIYSFLERNSSNFEVFIVDDGSTDGTSALCEKLCTRFTGLHIIQHNVNKGIGETLRSIHCNAKNKWVVNVPADGQFDIEELLNIKLSNNDFVAFYRKENLIYNTKRNILSWINKFVLMFFLNLDVLDVNWVKVYPSIFFKTHTIYLKSSLIESEIVYKLLQRNFNMVQIPSRYLSRNSGQSKGSSLKVVSKAFIDLFKLVYVCRVKRF